MAFEDAKPSAQDTSGQNDVAATSCGIAVVAKDWLIRHAVAHLIKTSFAECPVSIHAVSATVDPSRTILLIWHPARDDVTPSLTGVTVLGLGDVQPGAQIPWLPYWRADAAPTIAAIAALYRDCVAARPELSLLSATRISLPYLTKRQTNVLKALADGLSNADIAAYLQMSENTVRIHVSAILKSLKVSNRTQAALQAARVLNSQQF